MEFENRIACIATHFTVFVQQKKITLVYIGKILNKVDSGWGG